MSLPDDEPNLNPTGFDPDVAGPREWAEMYRAAGFQVVPCKDKRPDLARWADLQETLVSDATFARWYGTGREHGNMGMITGPCSGNVFVVDLDIQTHVAAAVWWESLIEAEASGIEPETVEQITGGGGEQKLFRAPAGYRVPTNRTSIGVDIRGQAGFAVLPPTKHASGNEYAWKPLRGPWECRITDAPQWLLDAIEALVGEHGGHQSNGERTASPEAETDAFGNVQDGREVVMRGCVWRAVLERYRENPVKPPDAASMILAKEAYEGYERKVTSRIPSVPKRDGLEKEGRGPTAFYGKWRATMRHWGSPKMQREAAKPNPKEPEPDPSAAFEQAKASGKVFEFFNVPQIKAWRDPRWVIDKLVAEQSVGFIYGPTRSLKTFIALDIALCLSTSRPDWWGYAISGGGAVVYICNEGHAFLKYRIAAWEQNRGTSADASHFHLIKQAINFLKADDVGTLLNTVEVIADKCKQPIAAVFVDTVSKSLPGAKENLQEDMSIFIAACCAVRDKFKTVVVGIHHTNKEGSFRGSSVMPNGSDFLIETRRDGNAMVGSIYADKVKDGVDGWERFFEVRQIVLSDIKGTSSLVVEGVSEEPVKAASNKLPEKHIAREILAGLSENWFNKKPWCHSSNSPRCAVTIISKRWRIDRRVVKDMLAEWMANEVIAHEVCDAKNHIVGYRKLTDL